MITIREFTETIDLFQKVKTIFEKKSAFITISIIISLSFIWNFLKAVNLYGKNLYETIPNIFYLMNLTIIHFLIGLLFFVSWLFIRRVPKFNKDEIGLLLAIKTDNEKLKIRIRNDFIHNLYDSMRVIGIKISIKYLSEYHCEKIYTEKEKQIISKYHYKTNAQLIIFGYADVRTHANNECYYLQLEESVSHGLINELARIILLKEMSTYFPREALIEINNEVFGFKIASNVFGFVSKYILGITCLLSNKVDYAIKFHSSILNDVPPDFPKRERIVNSTKKLLYQELIWLGKQAYLVKNDLDALKIYIDKSIEYYKDPSYYLLLAIYYFLKSRDIESSKKALDEAHNLDAKSFVWAYSKAFLFAYEGNLTEAYRTYQKAFKNNTNPLTHIECEVFIKKIIEIEPLKFQLWYCLGLIYYFVHKDYSLAKDSFLKFKEHAKKENLYSDIIPYIDKYINDIKQSNCN